MTELDQAYVERMEDVLATYEKPCESTEPVVCVDEKAVSLHQEIREPIILQPGQVTRRDSEYKRCGTANIFCGVEGKAGVHFTEVTEKRSARAWAGFMKGVADFYAQAQTIHVVMDNLNIHRRKALVDRYGEEDGDALWQRFTVHYTPKHGSWLNQAEIEIGLLARQCLGQRRIADLAKLSKEVGLWNAEVNRRHIQIHWKFDRAKARKKFRYDPIIIGSEN